MGADTDTNHHFKLLLEGVGPEPAAKFGEAFLELARQRSGQAELDSAAKLRNAWLELARALLRRQSGQLNEQQQLFLYSGAVADSVTLKDAQGERITVELLPAALYAGLLAAMQPAGLLPPWIMTPAQRLYVLASAQLKPYDANRSARWKSEALLAPGEEAGARPRPAVSLEELQASFTRWQTLQQELGARTKSLVAVLSSDNLGPVMQSLLHVGNEVKRLTQDGQALANIGELQLDGPPASHQSIARLHRLNEQFSDALASLERGQLELLEQLDSTVRLARSVASDEAGPALSTAAPAVTLAGDAAALKLLESDLQSAGSLVTQTMLNDAKRSAWSPARVLLAEQLDKFSDPLNDCLLTPEKLAQSFQAMGKLHINCFDVDSAGRSSVPAVFIEPGCGIVKWLDDRFIASFVQTEAPRLGSQLSLSSIDIAMLRIHGLFLARGDIFNYRGERISDSFMAEYAGHIEQKATVKFTGASKKLSYGTSTEEKDGASRDDAVSDYIDFIFAIFNGLPVPKKISPRKIGIILKYCVFRDVWFTACLVMRMLAPTDAPLAREILLSLGQKYRVHAAQLVSHSLEADPQVAARYRNDASLALKEVMGKLADELQRAAAGGGEPGEVPPAGATETVHDYFDV